jgi:hypothetical protein
MASTTDVRQWAKDHGYEVKVRGNLTREVHDAYDAAHPEQAEGQGELELEQAEAEAELSGEVVGPDLPPAVDRTAESAPRKPKGRGPFAGIGGRGRGPRPARPAKTKAGPRRPARPRVALTGLIESAWSDLAWAASSVPPMQRMLYAQAPFAGIALEDGLRDTFIDRMLQPVARGQAKAEAVGGLLMPPMALALVLATAPQPQQTEQGLAWPEPSTEHKFALLMLRYSLTVMAKAGQVRLEDYQAKAVESAERGRQADMFMAFILGGPMPAADGQAPDDEQAAQAMAAAMFGATA